MKLSKKNALRHREILRRVKAGIPLAGLLTGMAVLTGCDKLQPVGTEPRTVGKEPAPIKLAGDEPAPVRTVGEEPEPAKCPAPAPKPAPGSGAREVAPPNRTAGVPLPPPPPPPPPRPLAGIPVTPDRSPKGK